MLVIFDFDGTLADTWEILARELVAGAPQFGYRPVDRAKLEGLRQVETREVFRRLGVRWWRLPRLVAHLRRRAEALAGEMQLFPGIGDVVIALADAGHTLAVVSSNSEDTVRRVLGAKLNGRFRHFACSSALFGKARKFRKLRKLADAAVAVAVGDETRDLDAARDAGIAAIAVEWGYADAALLRRLAPNATAATPADLATMLALYARERRFR